MQLCCGLGLTTNQPRHSLRRLTTNQPAATLHPRPPQSLKEFVRTNIARQSKAAKESGDRVRAVVLDLSPVTGEPCCFPTGWLLLLPLLPLPPLLLLHQALQAAPAVGALP